MTCRACQLQIGEWLDGTMTDKRASRVREHVRACPACRRCLAAELERMRLWPQALARAVRSGLIQPGPQPSAAET